MSTKPLSEGVSCLRVCGADRVCLPHGIGGRCLALRCVVHSFVVRDLVPVYASLSFALYATPPSRFVCLGEAARLPSGWMSFLSMFHLTGCGWRPPRGSAI